MDSPTLDRHFADLASPDPAIRDERAYSALASAISDGALTPDQRRQLGGQLLERFGHPEAFARSFAPLIVAALASTWSDGDGEWPAALTEAVLSWWPAERDLRGYDESLGWIHAVAHGADAVGELGRHRLAPASRLLSTVAERLIAPTEFVWRDQEDDRIAAAVVGILLGDGNASLTPLLDPVQTMFATAEPGPVPPAASNSMRTLRSLYVALGNDVVDPAGGAAVRLPNAPDLQATIAGTLQVTTPWLFATVSATPGCAG